MVDDGSDPGCAAAITQIAQADSRIRILDGGHYGVSHARNKGIEDARGEWLVFVDADDEVEACFISEALLVALGEGVDLVCGSVGYVLADQEKSFPESDNGVCWIVDDANDLASVKMQMLGHMKYGRFVGPDFHGRGPHAKLYKAEHACKVEYDEGVAIGEDTLFNYRFIEQCDSIAIVDKTWHWYYQYAGSTMHSPNLECWKSSIDGILSARNKEESIVAFLSRCAFAVYQGLEGSVMSQGVWRAHSCCIDLLCYAGEKGVFAYPTFEGYELTLPFKMFMRFCAKEQYELAYWFVALKVFVKSAKKERPILDAGKQGSDQ